MDKKYIIRNVSEEQMEAIQNALSVRHDLGSFCFDKVFNHIFNTERDNIIGDSVSKNMCYQHDKIKSYLSKIKEILTDDNYSFQFDDNTKISYDIAKNISDTLYFDNTNNYKLSTQDDIIIEESNERIGKIIKLLHK